MASPPPRPEVDRSEPPRPVAPGLHVVERPQRFFGLPVGTRMTVIALEEGLLLHSPVPYPPARLAHLGSPRFALAPNLLHHLYLGPWGEAGVELWCGQGLDRKRPDLQFAGRVDRDPHPFGDQVEVKPLECFSMTREVALLHRPSRSLIVSDLVFHFGREAPWTTRWAMRALGGYPGCRTTYLERLGMNRSVARREIETLLGWDFDRLIMAHGDIVESGGREALERAFGWLD